MEPLEIIAAAAAALRLAEQLADFVEKQRANAKQSGEWTDAQEQAFKDLQDQRSKSARWQPKK